MKAMIISLLALTALLDVWVLAKLSYAFRLLSFQKTEINNTEDLPTVSVCIAARNEVHAMTQCLERVVMTEYPKLEVIVLDDGSRDDTSILIKSFAHAGVRFIEGKPLPEGWLGKIKGDLWQQIVMTAPGNGTPSIHTAGTKKK